MKLLTLFLCLFWAVRMAAQTGGIIVQDDAKVGFISTGVGANIQVTQIFGKSPEYAEIKKSLASLEADIQKKANQCEQMTKDSLPVKYRDDCRSELIALNTRRDSIQKVDDRFREDVIRLAETFYRIDLNSERLRLAKKFFDEGKVSEADNVLKEKDIAATGDAALAVKVRNDSVLLQTANEFALKAQLKAVKMEYDSAQLFFAYSCKYFETMGNLWEFAFLLGKQNRADLALEYYEKALKLAHSKIAEAILAMNLGVFYRTVQKMPEAERMHHRSLEIFERLAKSNPAQFEPYLAGATMNLGVFYKTVQKMPEAEGMYRRSMEIYERLTKNNPAQFEPDLAAAAMNFGNFYSDIQKMAEAEALYRRSLEIQKGLVKGNPAQFEPDLAMTAMNLGNFYVKEQKMADADVMYRLSIEIRERLAKGNPAQFEPDLAMTAMNIGSFYMKVQKMTKVEGMYRRSLEIYEQLAKSNPAQFEPDLAATMMNLGVFYRTVQKMAEAEGMLRRSLEIYERLAKGSPTQFEPDLAGIVMNLGVFYRIVQKVAEAEAMYRRMLEIYERLAKGDPMQFEPDVAKAAMYMGDLCQTVQKIAEAEGMYRRSLEIYERLAKDNPAQFEPDLAETAIRLGLFYSVTNHPDEAILVLKMGLAVQQKLAEKIPVMHSERLAYMLNNLAFAHLQKSDLAQAKDCLEKSEAIKPDNSWVFRNWGCWYALQNELDLAFQNLQKTADLKYDDPDWIRNEPILQNLKNDVRFEKILTKIESNKQAKTGSE